jgi:uncharacterized membrane protein
MTDDHTSHYKPIFEQGLEKFPIYRIILSNALMLFWIALGTAACGFFNTLVVWIYLLCAVLTIFVLLRKAVCTHCYYYGKWCSAGWGKLAALLFRKGNMEQFGTCLGARLAPLIYGLLLLVPLVFGMISLIQKFTLFKIIVLILLILVAVYSGTINRKKACAICKMKLICPGGNPGAQTS